MARNDRMSGRNRNGGYDLSAAYETSSRSASRRGEEGSRSPYDSSNIRATRRSGASASHHSASSTGGRLSSSSSNRGNSGTYHRTSAADSGKKRSTSSSHSHATEHHSAAHYSRNATAARSGVKRKSRKKRKVVTSVLVVLLLVLIGAGTAFGLWFSNVNDKISSDIAAVEHKSNEPYYVLLLGGDSRADSKTDNRSDSIMVARVDEKNKKVSLISVPRDLRVKIEGHGYCKINSAITYGGIEQTIATVGDLLGIQINYYAFIYFSGFEQLVDALDGVTVEVPEGTYYHGVSVPAGDAVLINGKEALVLARCRHGNPPDQGAYAAGDYQRTMNQRNLIKAIAKKILSQPVTSYPKLIGGLAECIETNMSVSTMVGTAKALRGMDVDSMQAVQLYTAGDVVGGEWFACLYEDAFQVQRSNFVNGDDLHKGLDNFAVDYVNNDMTSYAVDGEKYAYVYYEKHYGSFK